MRQFRKTMEFFNKISFLIAGWIFLVAIVSVLIALNSFSGTRTANRLSNLESEQGKIIQRLGLIDIKLDKILSANFPLNDSLYQLSEETAFHSTKPTKQKKNKAGKTKRVIQRIPANSE